MDLSPLIPGESSHFYRNLQRADHEENDYIEGDPGVLIHFGYLRFLIIKSSESSFSYFLLSFYKAAKVPFQEMPFIHARENTWNTVFF